MDSKVIKHILICSLCRHSFVFVAKNTMQNQIEHLRFQSDYVNHLASHAKREMKIAHDILKQSASDV